MDASTREHIQLLQEKIAALIHPQAKLSVIVRYEGKDSPPVIFTQETDPAPLVETIITELPQEGVGRMKSVAEENLKLRRQLLSLYECLTMVKDYFFVVMCGEYKNFTPSRKPPLLSIEDVIFRKATKVLGDISGTTAKGKRSN